MQIPSRTELERWFDAEQAGEVQFVETVASWPSLRILDYLSAGEPATTGDVARGLNMDMQDVRDRLDALESHDVVEESNDGWQTTTDRISVTLATNGGLEVAHAVGDESQSDGEQADQESDAGVVAGLRRAISSLFS